MHSFEHSANRSNGGRSVLPYRGIAGNGSGKDGHAFLGFLLVTEGPFSGLRIVKNKFSCYNIESFRSYL